jgi:hypothetical protein
MRPTVSAFRWFHTSSSGLRANREAEKTAAICRPEFQRRLASSSRDARDRDWQARGATLLAGLSGFYMVHRLDLWSEFSSIAYWWLDAMVLVWLLFTLMLFVAEPLFLDRWLQNRARLAPESTFALIQRLHWGLLVVSLITVFGAVAGSHGLSFFR